MHPNKVVDLVLEELDPTLVMEKVRQALSAEQRRRAEFRAWLKPEVKAEFILGELVTHSPAQRGHNVAVTNISTLLRVFCAKSDAGEVAVEKAMVETLRNDFEPDVACWRAETARTFTDDMVIYPPPDLVVEVLSKSTEARDCGVKYRDYLREGVGEYWIVDPRTRQVEQHLLDKGYENENLYRQTVLNGQAVLDSPTIPGLSLPVAAFFYEEAFKEALRALSAR